jgi:integrase
VKPLTHDNASAILDRVTGHWVEPRVLLGSGLRVGEFVDLDQKDLVLDAGFVRMRIRRTKTSVRAVPISDVTVDALREALRDAPGVGPDEPVFFMPRPARRKRVRDGLRGDVITHAPPYLLERRGCGA